MGGATHNDTLEINKSTKCPITCCDRKIELDGEFLLIGMLCLVRTVLEH